MSFSDIINALYNERSGDMGKYDDIINLPHHVSNNRSCIPREERAAQFSPFAALTGFDDMITEEGRWVDSKSETDENQKAIINEKLIELQMKIEEHPTATVEYFLPDSEKEGGVYTRITDIVVKIDSQNSEIVFESGTRIPFENIISID